MSGASREYERTRLPMPRVTAFPDVQAYAKHGTDPDDPAFDVLSGNGSEDGDDELFNLDDGFTVEHDLFLVRHWCFQPDTTLDDLAILARRELGVDRSAGDIERRLQVLQADEYSALLSLYLKVISTEREASGQVGHSGSLKTQFQPLLRRLRPSCETKLLQLVYEDEKMQAEPSDMIPVDVSSRNFPKYTRLVNKRQLLRCSKQLRDLFRHAGRGADTVFSQHQAFSLHGLKTGTEKLQLTDSAPFYDTCMVFNHLEQPIFDRLLQFAKDPNAMERLALQKQQLEEQKHIKRTTSHQLQMIFSSQSKAQLAKLEEMRTSELESITRNLEKTLDDDILHLRRMHESILKHEKAKVHAKYNEQIAKLQQHIVTVTSEVNALQNRCNSNGWNMLDQDIARSALQVERIFGASDYILRLLILAEDLDADPLRRALAHYLSKPGAFPQFALRRELTSTMISESTVIEILKRVPTPDLRDVETAGKRFAHHELLTREIHTRRVTFSRFIAGLTNDQLRVVSRIKSEGMRSVLESSDGDFVPSELIEEMAPVTDFPDVLDREFARRREFSWVKMNSAGVDHLVSFSEDDCFLQLEASNRYCSVLATNERKQGESGKWMFEVFIEVFAGEGESILVGWEVPRSSSSSVGGDSGLTVPFVPGLTPGVDGRGFGITWQSDGGLEMGMLHANGQSKSGIACFRAGDVIGCTINQDELVPYMRFYLNGVQVIPSLSTALQSPGIACQNPVYCLFPVVSMYSSRKKPQMSVRFNFRGQFRFPVDGFEAYGAPL